MLLETGVNEERKTSSVHDEFEVECECKMERKGNT